jgi:hypothetical protein
METKPFLERLAQDLWERHGVKIARMHIILPSRRACLYFKYYLAKVAAKNILAPEVLSYNDFIQKLSNIAVPDKVSLLFGLYTSFRHQQPGDVQTAGLEHFLPLGAAMLGDFNTIDRNLDAQQAQSLFGYLEEVKALERWAENLDKPLEVPAYSTMRDFLGFWKNLEATFWHFRKQLLAQQQAYSGLAYRLVHENLEALLKIHEVESTVFAGFYQLTLVEEQIMANMVKLGIAETFWDADSYYVHNEQQEAGAYLRKYLRSWLPATYPFYDHQVLKVPQRVDIYSVSNHAGQVKLAGDLLARHVQETIAKGEWESFSQGINRLGILLPDEQLLLPLLYSLPTVSALEGIDLGKYINISMGLNLAGTPLIDLIRIVFSLQMNQRKAKGGEIAFYYKDVVGALKHPFLQFHSTFAAQNETLVSHIYAHNMVYLTKEWMENLTGPTTLYHCLFTPWQQDIHKGFDALFTLIGLLHKTPASLPEQIEQAFLQKLYTLLNRLKDVLTAQKEVVSLRVFRQFLLEMLRQESVPFSGEPLAPIQIMGMLESRALDFEHLIVLSCNEGKMPGDKKMDSIIPHDLKVLYRLPTYRENDASAAYTFYRLLHYAKTIACIYNDPYTSGDGKEKSRFLTQVEEEMALLKASQESLQVPQVKAFQLIYPLPQQNTGKLAVHKSDKILEKIAEILAKGLSPTAINTYIRSPLEFFQRSVLRMKDPEEVEEHIGHKDFGTVLHGALDKLLQPYVGQALDTPLMASLLKDPLLIANTVDTVFVEELGGIVTDSGKNSILRKVIIRLIERFLGEHLGPNGQCHLVDLEVFYDHTLQVTLPGGMQLPFRVAGKADRVDMMNGHLRIVDYKTGSFENKDLKTDHFFSLFLEPEKAKVVQLLVYKYLLMQMLAQQRLTHLPPSVHQGNVPLASGFYFFRKLDAGFVNYEVVEENENPARFQDMAEAFLTAFVTDLMDPTQPFSKEPSVFRGLFIK